MAPPSLVSPGVHSDPDILSGVPVFVGTRVPLKALFDYLAGGHPLAEFLDDFPSVAREQSVAALLSAAQSLMTEAVLEKLAAGAESDYLEPRAARGSQASYEQVLAKVPAAPPVPGDEL